MPIRSGLLARRPDAQRAAQKPFGRFCARALRARAAGVILAPALAAQSLVGCAVLAGGDAGELSTAAIEFDPFAPDPAQPGAPPEVQVAELEMPLAASSVPSLTASSTAPAAASSPVSVAAAEPPIGALSADPAAAPADYASLAVEAVAAFRDVCVVSLGDPNTAVAQLYTHGFAPSPSNGLRYEKGVLIAGLSFRDFQGPRSCYVGAPAASAPHLARAFEIALRSAALSAARAGGDAPVWRLTLAEPEAIADVQIVAAPSPESEQHAALRLQYRPAAP